MDDFTKKVKLVLEFLRCSPHLLVYLLHPNRKIIKKDVVQWLKANEKPFGSFLGLVYLLGFQKPFRNLFYYRTGSWHFLLGIICPKESTLKILVNDIGEGLVIWHGYATTIGAKKIGRNCTINHQVTIGNNNGYPTLLDNVTVHAGAIILGSIVIGNNAIIGANTTVLKDVPDNSTVLATPSRIMTWKQDTAP